MAVVKEIEAESLQRQCSKSEIVRERLTRAGRSRVSNVPASTIADLVGSVDGLPPNLSARKKGYLKKTGYGRKRSR